LGHNSATCGRPRDEYGRLIQKKKNKATSAGVQKRKRKANSGGGEQTKRAKTKKSKSRALVTIGPPTQSSQTS